MNLIVFENFEDVREFAADRVLEKMKITGKKALTARAALAAKRRVLRSAQRFGFENFEDVREFAANERGRWYVDEKGRKWDNDTLGARYAGRGAALHATIGAGAGLLGSSPFYKVLNLKGKKALLARAAFAGSGAAAGAAQGALYGYGAGKAVQSERRRRALRES
ncbi:hypothetical protein EBZ80_10495 [bacterium]|nr:hypothetical protein [bacterium]